jgi:hypothetical protein
MKRSTIYWFLHNFLAHGLLMAFTGESEISLRVHDWTALRAKDAENQEALARLRSSTARLRGQRVGFSEVLEGRR